MISCREHDKGPDELSVVLRQLMDGDFDFTISLLGNHTTDIPGMNLVDNNDCLSITVDIESFKELIPKLGARLLHSDHVPTDCYWEIISKADVVVSTAQHEFFGVAMYAIFVLCRMLGRIMFNVFPGWRLFMQVAILCVLIDWCIQNYIQVCGLFGSQYFNCVTL